MRSLIQFFVERHLLVNVVAIAIVATAFYFGTALPREYSPAIDMPIARITAVLPGASVKDVEANITMPLEEALETVDNIKEFKTTISDSVSFSTVEFYFDMSKAQVDAAMQELRDAISRVKDFPLEMESEPSVIQVNPKRLSVVEVVLTGPEELITTVAEDFERRMRALSHVSRVAIVGLQEPEVHVLVDPNRMKAHGITILDVVQAVKGHNVSGTGAVLESAEKRQQVTVWSRYDDPVKVSETIVPSRLRVLRIKDIARVELTREDTGLITHANGKPGLSISVYKRENADAIDTVDQVKDLLDRTVLPEGVAVELFNDDSFQTRNRLEVIVTNGLLGAVLVALMLFLFMRRDAAIWVLAGIPLVFCAAVASFYFFGFTLNMFTLSGLVLVLGMVVDDAVVVSENIVAHRARGSSAYEAAIDGATEMLKPVTTAAITTMLAFLPILALGGIAGKFLWQIPAAVLLALIFSLLESFVILPAHMSKTKSIEAAQPREFVKKLERLYRGALRWCFSNRLLITALTVSWFAFVMVQIRPLVPFVQFSQDDTYILFVKITSPIGTPIERTEAIVVDLQKQIGRITDVDLESMTARVGHQDIGALDKNRGDAENEAMITVLFKPLNRQKTNAQWIQQLNAELSLPDGVDVKMVSDVAGPPTDQPVTIHVLANENTTRQKVAAEIYEWVNAQPGTTEVEIDERLGTPELSLKLDYEKLSLLNVRPDQVVTAVQASFAGAEASDHREITGKTTLRVMFDPSFRRDLNDLLDSPIRARDGTLVSLRDAVVPVVEPSQVRIFHHQGVRAATIRGSFTPDSGLTALSFAHRFETELLPTYDELQGVEVLIGGEAADTKESTARLGVVALLAMLSVSAVIWILLGSLLEAILVVAAIPLAVAGVIFAFYMHDTSLSMTAMVGCIGLAGVVVNASIVMIDAIHRKEKLHQPGSEKEQFQLITETVVGRLRPIVVTTLTTVVGVLPTAYGIGGYDSVISSMSLAIGWGLIFSTLITLFVIPVLFVSIRQFNQKMLARQIELVADAT